MRNWHLFVPVLISFPLPQSFYITYEELTPNLCIVFDQCIDRVLHYLWGIDTYIVLDHCFVFDIFVLHYLWGIDTSFAVTSLSVIYVLHYLWGIDTFHLLRCQLSYLCFTLPMRNWHHYCKYSNHVDNYKFYITYEELTLSIFCWNQNAVIHSHDVLHYLWGIDTL